MLACFALFEKVFALAEGKYEEEIKYANLKTLDERLYRDDNSSRIGDNFRCWEFLKCYSSSSYGKYQIILLWLSRNVRENDRENESFLIWISSSCYQLFKAFVKSFLLLYKVMIKLWINLVWIFICFLLDFSKILRYLFIFLLRVYCKKNPKTLNNQSLSVEKRFCYLRQFMIKISIDIFFCFKELMTMFC